MVLRQKEAYDAYRVGTGLPVFSMPGSEVFNSRRQMNVEVVK